MVRILLALLLLTTTGCYRTTFINEKLLPTNEEEDSTRTPFFVWGAVGDADVDVRTYCKYDAYKVTLSADPIDVLITTMTLGLLSMRSIAVQCGAPPASAGAPTP